MGFSYVHEFEKFGTENNYNNIFGESVVTHKF